MIARLLDRVGIIYRWRVGMSLNLDTLSERPNLPPGYEVIPWDASRLTEVAQVDHLSYYNTVDSRLYWSYFATPAGCERMWREALNGRFGQFDPERTLLLTRDGAVVGDVMACTRAPAEGFIGNLAVLPEHRGGTGRALLLSCLHRFREAGFYCVSLAVTLENQRACRLYRSLGFRETGRFPVVTWSRGR
ncbi:MAG: GNAT family N-acetyltransferase [Armatimonadetes bacterium]|nr:GNAT family N-acetyltransferase [Armatimonadota bacterium]